MLAPPHRSIPIAPIVIILFLLLSGRSPAQRRDVKISPDIAERKVSGELLFQSAASVGRRTLAIWGAGDSVTGRGSIRMQMLDGGTPIGAQRALNDTAAEPYGPMQVLPFGNSFLVAWNERRDGTPGFSIRRFGLDGEAIGDARKINTRGFGSLRGGWVHLFGKQSSGATLLWPDTTSASTLRMIHIDTSGAIDGVESVLDEPIRAFFDYQALPGAALGQVSRAKFRFFDSAGRLDPRPLPHIHQDSVFAIGDMLFAELRGDTVLLYHSIFEQIPYRTIPVPALDSARPNGRTLIVDSLGLRIIYLVTRLYDDLPSQGFSTWFTNGYELRVDTDGALHDPAQVYHDSSAFERDYIDTRGSRTLDRVGRVTGSNNTTLITLDWTQSSEYHHIYRSTSWTVGFSTDARGLVADSSRHIPLHYLPLPPRATRLPDTTRSAILVMVPEGPPVTLASAAPTPVVFTNRPQISPCITLDGGVLVTSWMEGVPTDKRSAEWHYVAGRWNGAEDTAIETGRILPFEPTPPGGPDAISFLFSSRDSWSPTSGIPTLLRTNHTCETYRRIITPSSSERIVANHDAVYECRPGAEGWRVRVLKERSKGDDEAREDCRQILKARPMGYDPNEDLTATLVDDIPYYQYPDTLYVMMAGGDRKDSILAPRTSSPLAIISEGRDRYWWIDSARATLRDARKSLYYYFFETVDTAARYQRLLGPYFVRITRPGDAWKLELYILEGRLAASRTVIAPPGTVEMTLAQNPGDSGIALLWSGSEGVHATLLDRYLEVRRENAPISSARTPAAHAVGVFRNDSLFAVWEDHRNGAADIYAAVATMKEIADVEREEGTKRPLEAVVAPNAPAGAQARLVVRGAGEGRVEITMVDMLGRTARRFPAATARGGEELAVPLDLSGLAAGSYLIEVVNGMMRGSARVMVVR